MGNRTILSCVCNVNMLCNILGRASYFGLPTDESCHAPWLIALATGLQFALAGVRWFMGAG